LPLLATKTEGWVDWAKEVAERHRGTKAHRHKVAWERKRGLVGMSGLLLRKEYRSIPVRSRVMRESMRE
jgi:hypothetical protein